MKFALVFFSIFLAFKTRVTQGAEVPNRSIKVQLQVEGFKPWDYRASASSFNNFNSAVHLRPLYFSREYKIKPGYIKSWKWDFKRKLYVFIIDRSIRFHSGARISAYDFEFALTKPFISTMPDRVDKIPLSIIKGSKLLKTGEEFKTGMLAGIKVIDETTIEVSLEEHSPSFIFSLGSIVPPLGPIDSFSKDYYTPRDLPIGCGPFRVTWSDPNSTMVRVARVDSRAAKVNVPMEIEFYSDGNALTNKVDLAVAAGLSYTKKGDFIERLGRISKAIQVLDFNYGNVLGKNKNFRSAIAHAINRQSASVGYPWFRPTNQLIPKGFLGRAQVPPMFDLEKAKYFLKKVPSELLKEPVKIIYHGTKKTPRFLKAIKHQLEEIGLQVHLVQTDQTWIEENDSTSTMYIFGNVVEFSDPLLVYAHYLRDGPSPAHTDRNDENFERLYDLAYREVDLSKRSILLQQITKHMHSEVRMIPLVERYQSFGYGKRIDSIGDVELTFDYDKVLLKQEKK